MKICSFHSSVLLRWYTFLRISFWRISINRYPSGVMKTFISKLVHTTRFCKSLSIFYKIYDLVALHSKQALIHWSGSSVRPFSHFRCDSNNIHFYNNYVPWRREAGSWSIYNSYGQTFPLHMINWVSVKHCDLFLLSIKSSSNCLHMRQLYAIWIVVDIVFVLTGNYIRELTRVKVYNYRTKFEMCKQVYSLYIFILIQPNTMVQRKITT